MLLLAHSQFRALFVGLARRLREDNGVAVHLYVATVQEQAFYQRTASASFDSIVVMRSLYENIEEPVADAVGLFRRAEACEQRLGVSFNSIVLTDRHLGRGFALGGFRHPRSVFSEIADYPRVVRAVIDHIDFWEGEVDRHKASLLINCGKTAAVIARQRGLPYRAVIGARYKNLQYWAHNEYGDFPGLVDVYNGTDGGTTEVALETPYATHMEMRRHLSRNHGLLATLQRIVLTTAQQAYWNLRRYEKARGYFLRERIGYLWRQSRSARNILATHKTTLTDLKGQRFVYFPLHMEPEIALQGFSPECFSQLSCIASLARDLPAGTVLAVKETIAALGRRPRDFYEQLAEFKNIVLLRPDQLGLNVAMTADATATITGSGGFEAAVSGRPVISFGRHNLYNILPHVYPITHEEDLYPALCHILGPEFDHAAAVRDGKRFLQAITETAFDLEDFKILNPDTISDAAISGAYASLLASLKPQAFSHAS